MSSLAKSAALSVRPCTRCLMTSRCGIHTSSVASAESKKRKIARLKKKENLAHKAAAQVLHTQTAPHPILGYHQTSTWEQSRLRNILLDKNHVWAVDPNSAAASDDAASATAGDPLLDLNTATDAVKADKSAAKSLDHAPSPPELLNFGLSSSDAQLLFKSLPQISAQKPLVQFDTARKDLLAKAEETEFDKRDQLMRIVDLRNADAKGIRAENKRRVVQEFSRLPDSKDTGSPEVQVALLTMKIRNMASHLVSAPKDNTTIKALHSLAARRARLFKYLKKLSFQRYNEGLKACGLEARAVEGEVVILKDDFRGLKNQVLSGARGSAYISTPMPASASDGMEGIPSPA